MQVNEDIREPDQGEGRSDCGEAFVSLAHPVEKIVTRTAAQRSEPSRAPVAVATAAGKTLDMQRRAVIDEVKKSSLRGAAGAGFRPGSSGGFLAQGQPKPKYLCITPTSPSRATARTASFSRMTRTRCSRASHGVLGRSALTLLHLRARRVQIPSSVLEKAIAEAYADGIFGKKLMGKDSTPMW